MAVLVDQFQTIIETSSDGIIIVDVNGYVRFANPATESLFGRANAELVNSMFGFPVVAGETIELDILRRNGDVRIVEMRVVEMMWEDDLVHLATLRDVTERKQREVEIGRLNMQLGEHVEAQTMELNRLHERLSVIFTTTTDAILLVNSSGQIDFANPAFERQFGYAPEEYLNQPLSMLIVPLYRESFERSIAHVVATGELFRGQVIAQHKDTSTLDIELSLVRVVNNDSHLVCNLHDISHFVAVERMKDNFISMVNHELRTPISSAMLSLDVLQNYFEKMPIEKVRSKLIQSRQQMNNLREIVEGVLEISQVEAQRGEHGRNPVHVRDTLSRVFDEMKPSALEKQQIMHMFATEEPLIVTGNALDFTRIWRNLISNAIKYTPNEGRIIVRLAHLYKDDCTAYDQPALTDRPVWASALEASPVDLVVGQVEDTGYGIQPEYLESTFQRFNRGWAKNSGIPGTGLGLALVRDILEIYEGGIHVSSEVGTGSIFTFWLPLQ